MGFMVKLFLQILARLVVVSVIAGGGLVLAARGQTPQDWLAFWRPTEGETTQTLLVLDTARRLEYALVREVMVQDATLAWSTDGVLAFNGGSAEGSPTNIWLFDADTVTIRDPFPEPALEYTPAWSQDGRLAFVGYGNTERENIFIYDLASDTVRQATQDASANNYTPAWSPDGRLAFVSRSMYTGNADIFIQTIPGGPRYNITQDMEENSWPGWTSAGEMVYGANRLDRYTLYIYDGIKSRVLVDNVRHLNRAAAIQGSRLAFADGDAYAADDLFLLDMTDNSITNLTDHPAADFWPTWTADGRLALVSDRHGNADLFVLNVADGSLVNLTQSAEGESFYAWMPSPSP